jgi:hypothetical protein
MATTTPALIRDRVSAVIKALVPIAHAGDGFVEDRAQYAGDYREFAKALGPGVFRRFQARDAGIIGLPEVSDMVTEELQVTIEVLVGYGQDHRAGGDAFLRDRLIHDDWQQINFAVGWCGRSNFPAGSAYDCCWRGGNPKRIERVDGLDVLVIENTYSFHQARS